MIELYISTQKNITVVELVQLFVQQEVKCIVIENFSSCVNKCNNSIKQSKMIAEKGFIIKIFDLPPSSFKVKVWNILKDRLKLICAFVESDIYKGCILNWPNIFVESNCAQNK